MLLDKQKNYIITQYIHNETENHRNELDNEFIPLNGRGLSSWLGRRCVHTEQHLYTMGMH